MISYRVFFVCCSYSAGNTNGLMGSTSWSRILIFRKRDGHWNRSFSEVNDRDGTFTYAYITAPFCLERQRRHTFFQLIWDGLVSVNVRCYNLHCGAWNQFSLHVKFFVAKMPKGSNASRCCFSWVTDLTWFVVTWLRDVSRPRGLFQGNDQLQVQFLGVFLRTSIQFLPCFFVNFHLTMSRLDAVKPTPMTLCAEASSYAISAPELTSPPSPIVTDPVPERLFGLKKLLFSLLFFSKMTNYFSPLPFAAWLNWHPMRTRTGAFELYKFLKGKRTWSLDHISRLKDTEYHSMDKNHSSPKGSEYWPLLYDSQEIQNCLYWSQLSRSGRSKSRLASGTSLS